MSAPYKMVAINKPKEEVSIKTYLAGTLILDSQLPEL